MQTTNISTLKIHKLSQEQYERELAAGNIDEYALYLTPDEEIDLSLYATTEQLASKAELEHSHDDYETKTDATTKLTTAKLYTDSRLGPITTSGTGTNYTATVEGISSLIVGASFVMVPNVVSNTTAPALNVNGLGAKPIRRRLSSTTGTTVSGSSASWLTANKPIRVTYDGSYWVVDIDRPSATDIYGTLPIASGGTNATNASTALANLGGMPNVAVTASDAGKFLRVNSSGVWAAETVPDAETTSF